jgi:thiol:disulfide interchange protein
MASPYVIIGLNPKLVAFLPKPGEWMVTFKQVMGFVMMLTVVYLLFTLNHELTFAALTTLVGVTIACWMIGRVPPTESRRVKLANTLAGLGICVAMGIFAFHYIPKSEPIIPWVTYRDSQWPELENDIRAQQMAGKTVMVDFTANWCPTCKWNFAWAIDTKEVAELVKEYEVESRIVDWSDTTSPYSPDLQRFINQLGANSIPLLAIFPANQPDKALVLSDLLTKERVLDGIREAGPSLSVKSTAAIPPGDTAHNR